MATLKDAPALHTLVLGFAHNQVSATGAQALAAMKDAQALHTLHLDLGYNQLGANGAQVCLCSTGKRNVQRQEMVGVFGDHFLAVKSDNCTKW